MPREDRVEDAGQPFRIGPYTVLRRIGRGAMGVVYSAYDEQLDRKIALKHLRGAPHEPGTLGQSRLLREAQALARVSHPNVVQVYEVGAHEREVYIAMEFVRGRTLREWVRGEVRAWREILTVYIQAGRGLAAAHAAGLVHRDFKPDNVMLGDDGRVRVMDFGLARALDEPGAALQAPSPHSSQDLSLSLTAAGRIVGTPAYMAPEQHIGGVTDARTDQFAFCVALYEGLYGQRPFAGDDLRALSASVTHGRLREPSRRLVPRWLRRIVLRGLAVDPARRWPSMQALLVEVERGQARARRELVAATLAGLGVLALGAWGWHEHTRAREAETCAAAGASIDEVWHDAARERVRGAFAATGVGHAVTTAEKVLPWIDRQATAWADARAAVCMEATRDIGDPALRDRSTWCLDERRMAIESLVAELSRPDVAMVQRAVAVAAALEPVSQCRDPLLLAHLTVPRRPTAPRCGPSRPSCCAP
ncbi:MAG TPA: serine/threonine-protein kinase, partial [Nannocystis sp.]